MRIYNSSAQIQLLPFLESMNLLHAGCIIAKSFAPQHAVEALHTS